jgi:ABC-type nitrate/sulfonate/bicarbonate transport system substrate-binding protein
MRITFARACRLAAPLAAALLVPALSAAPVEAETRDVEKPHIKLGFIKLTDMAPLAIAYEKAFFEDEGLFVTLEPQADWKALLDRVIDGESRRCAHAGGPTPRCHHRLHNVLDEWFETVDPGAHRHPALDGPQRQRHYRLQ